MRKPVSILLAVIILIFSLNISVSAHICRHMGTTIHIGYTPAKGCTCNGSGCCHEVVRVIKLKNEFLKEDILKLTLTSVDHFPPLFPVEIVWTNQNVSHQIFGFHPPPLKTISRAILNNSLLL